MKRCFCQAWCATFFLQISGIRQMVGGTTQYTFLGVFLSLEVVQELFIKSGIHARRNGEKYFTELELLLDMGCNVVSGEDSKWLLEKKVFLLKYLAVFF